MRPKRRKIKLDRGDTLGGTVPLLLRDSVTANGTEGRFLHKDRGDGLSLKALAIGFGVILVLTIAAWVALPDLMENLGIPTLTEVVERIELFFSVPEA